MQSLPVIGFVVMLTLKLSFCPELSWWAVTAPVWGAFAACFLLEFLSGLF